MKTNRALAFWFSITRIPWPKWSGVRKTHSWFTKDFSGLTSPFESVILLNQTLLCAHKHRISQNHHLLIFFRRSLFQGCWRFSRIEESLVGNNLRGWDWLILLFKRDWCKTKISMCKMSLISLTMRTLNWFLLSFSIVHFYLLVGWLIRTI